ncbi:MAG: hypothetical protein IJP96_05820 [Synergistaceae bacterium]|nr:hypothetical protein [Synergistaceae bacterium]MBQ6434563.1 hypothetical protein [Synergistaceae bacterium]MBQ6738105.1 hypothetical protein [Synergistaceae bacterium]MBR0075251.1 hypothetical protein [Synergistaceae bacterium]MBR0078785.1 hypothetical protein [Synergistaceae bacterium]
MKETLVKQAIIGIRSYVSYVRKQNKVKRHLFSLTTAEKDLLIYVYNRSKNVSNAVYIPYDYTIATDLKYKRILRRYKTIPTKIVRLKGTTDSKYCFMYGIRDLPRKFIEDGKIKDTNFPSAKLCDYLDKYQ